MACCVPGKTKQAASAEIKYADNTQSVNNNTVVTVAEVGLVDMSFSFVPLSTKLSIPSGSITDLNAKLQGYARVIPQKWSGTLVKDFLAKHIKTEDLAKWGTGSAKTFDQLAKELIRGECQFMVDESGKLVRCVEIIWCRVPNPKNPAQLLVETERVYTDGTARPVGKILGGKRRPLESISGAARRVIEKELTLDPSAIKIDEANLPESGIGEDRRDSPSYPGIESLYRIHIIPCAIELGELDEDLLEEFALTDEKGGDFHTTEVTGDKHKFTWMTESDAKSKGALIEETMPKKSMFDSLQEKFDEEFNWNMDMMKSTLDSAGVTHDGGAAVEALCSELKDGKLSIWENSSVDSNKIYAMETILNVKFTKGDEVFASSDGALPSILVRFGETVTSGYERLIKEIANCPGGATLKPDTMVVGWEEISHGKIGAIKQINRSVTVTAVC